MCNSPCLFDFSYHCIFLCSQQAFRSLAAFHACKIVAPHVFVCRGHVVNGRTAHLSRTPFQEGLINWSLSIGDRSHGNNTPSSIGRMVNTGLMAKACKARVPSPPPPLCSSAFIHVVCSASVCLLFVPEIGNSLHLCYAPETCRDERMRPLRIL